MNGIRKFVTDLRSHIERHVSESQMGHGGELRRDIQDLFHRALSDALLDALDSHDDIEVATRGPKAGSAEAKERAKKAAATRAANRNKSGVGDTTGGEVA